VRERESPELRARPGDVAVNLGGGRAALCHAREQHNAFARMARRGGVEQARRRCIGRLPFSTSFTELRHLSVRSHRGAAMRPGLSTP